MATTTKTMPYLRLGKSGLKVSRIILGCMGYGTSKWQDWVLDEEESMEHIKFAYDNGVQTFDTANMYSDGASEVVLGKAIKKYNLPRDEIVIMTKVYFVVKHQPEGYLRRISTDADHDRSGYVNQYGLSRKHIFDSVKKSLDRLQVDYIDLLQCHRFDYNTPIEETMQALHDVVKAGYVRYVGMSSCWAWQFAKMQNYAISHNLTPFISMQNYHNAIYREEEREMFPMLKDFGVGIIPFSPLARGLLTRPYGETTHRSQSDPVRKRYVTSKEEPVIVDRVEEVAKNHGVSMAQVALAWSLAKEGVTAPIVGSTKLENLQDLIAAIHLTLTEEEINYISEPYAPRSVWGHA